MKKILKITCLVVGICFLIAVAIIGAGAYYFYSKMVTPESKKLSKVYQLRSQNRPDEALALCDEILKNKPDYYPAQHCKGDILMQLKRYDDAVAFFDGIAKKDPRNSQALVSKADVQAKMKRYNEALDTYESALKANPGSCEAYQGKGDVLTSLERYVEALKAYDAGLVKTEGMT